MSRRWTIPPDGVAPASYLLDVGAAIRRPVGVAWMVTFADLVALMLTFFVLLFSMSQIESHKWQTLVRSLADNLDVIAPSKRGKPSVALQIEQDIPPPGTDLNYLTPVLLQQIGSEPSLAPGVIRRLPDRIVVSFPADLLFDPGARALAPRAGPAVYAIGSILRSLGNEIEVRAYDAPPSGEQAGAARWGTALARAVALTGGLSEAGYDGPVVARGYGVAREEDIPTELRGDQRAAFAARIDIVIHEQAKAAP